LNNIWVEPEVRDSVVQRLRYLSDRSSLPIVFMLKVLEIKKAKYYCWVKRTGTPNRHNGQIPKSHWLIPDEVEKIKCYSKEHYSYGDFFLKDGYRRLAYNMLDENIVAASPSSVYRILKSEGLLNKWNTSKRNLKGTGFKQPDYPHKHWHVDIKYLNFLGTFLFLIPVIDGYSRYVVHHEIRRTMTEYDVQLAIQKAKDKYPKARPRVITDNGAQFIAKEFKKFIKEAEFEHIKTSVNYPEANGKVERFNRTISEECLRVKSPLSLDEYKMFIEDYICFYNTKRLHGSLNYLTPEDFLMGRKQQRLKQRELKLQMAEEKRKLYWEKKSSAA